MKTLIALIVLVASGTAIAQDGAAKRGGFRIELQGGLDSTTEKDTDGGRSFSDAAVGSGYSGGVEAGFDFRLGGKVTLGPYGSFNIAGKEKCADTALTSQIVTTCFKPKSTFSLGGRLGVAAGRKGEVYATLGFDSLSFDGRFTLRNLPSNAVAVDDRYSDIANGVGAGIGYNHSITKNIYAGVGARYVYLIRFLEGENYLSRVAGQIKVGARF